MARPRLDDGLARGQRGVRRHGAERRRVVALAGREVQLELERLLVCQQDGGGAHLGARGDIRASASASSRRRLSSSPSWAALSTAVNSAERRIRRCGAGPRFEVAVERLELGQRLAQLGGHGVERRGEQANLVLAADGDLDVEVAGADGVGAGGERQNRIGDAARDEQRGERAEQARNAAR